MAAVNTLGLLALASITLIKPVLPQDYGFFFYSSQDAFRVQDHRRAQRVNLVRARCCGEGHHRRLVRFHRCASTLPPRNDLGAAERRRSSSAGCTCRRTCTSRRAKPLGVLARPAGRPSARTAADRNELRTRGCRIGEHRVEAASRLDGSACCRRSADRVPTHQLKDRRAVERAAWARMRAWTQYFAHRHQASRHLLEGRRSGGSIRLAHRTWRRGLARDLGRYRLWL